ncbi:uncharacterized protein LOC111048698 [Nilaparvata lugens]|uniref:uncharacterized protein LOC111048698 n=1 Tax=Nilaparvata lugens TaxID=108931 RepID=UPI00193E61D8|nr:uncharacterized protein LOC111048698 [Nilaparvata lugens]
MPFKWEEGAKPRKKIDADTMKNAVKTIIESGRSVRSVAQEFEIDRKTLGRYHEKIVKGVETTFNPNYNTCQIFSNDEEEDLKNYLILSSKLNYGLAPKELRKFAYEYAIARGKKVPENWMKNKSASYDWQMGFMSRHTELSLRNPQATSLARGTAFNETTVYVFFSNLRTVYKEHKFSPDAVYNIDETGLSTVHRPSKIISAKGQKQVSKVTSAERGTLITVCCAESAVGNAVPPFFVYPRKRVNDRMTQGAPPGSCAVGGESGWMTTDSFNHYLDHFIKNVKCSPTNPVLVVLDNHDLEIDVEEQTATTRETETEKATPMRRQAEMEVDLEPPVLPPPPPVDSLNMVRNQQQKPGARKYKDFSDENLSKAIQAVNEKTLSLRKAAEKYVWRMKEQKKSFRDFNCSISNKETEKATNEETIRNGVVGELIWGWLGKLSYWPDIVVVVDEEGQYTHQKLLLEKWLEKRMI